VLDAVFGGSKEAIDFREQCVHVGRGEARIVERVHPAEQRILGAIDRHQLIEVASSIERAAGRILQADRCPVRTNKLSVDPHDSIMPGKGARSPQPTRGTL
jgi:hypothetical protein